MGGGLARHELAGAVSAPGGLGTIGFQNPRALRAQVAAVRRTTERPVAVNLLLPFVRAAHFDAASEAEVVVTFWGAPQRRTSKVWIHQCASFEEALAACKAGADAVIAQGLEAGGHVRGTLPAAVLLAQLRDALPDDYPVLSAGGIAERSDVVSRLDHGAEAAVCGTRFLMTDESGAHPAYKGRLIDAQQTVLTELFGAGWPAPHRVVSSAATARWLAGDARGPRWLRALYRASSAGCVAGPRVQPTAVGRNSDADPAALRSPSSHRGRPDEPRRRRTPLRVRVHRTHPGHPPRPRHRPCTHALEHAPHLRTHLRAGPGHSRSACDGDASTTRRGWRSRRLSR
jgi:nitronate monooxygenase